MEDSGRGVVCGEPVALCASNEVHRRLAAWPSIIAFQNRTKEAHQF